MKQTNKLLKFSVIFVLGKPLYRVTKPSGNMLLLVTKCIGVHKITL